VGIPKPWEEDGCEERRQSQKNCGQLPATPSERCGQRAGLAGRPRYWELRNEPRSRPNTRVRKAWSCQYERESLGWSR